MKRQVKSKFLHMFNLMKNKFNQTSKESYFIEKSGSLFPFHIYVSDILKKKIMKKVKTVTVTV